ncbi:autotransporter outer membrane beta-barrel domain-containing protein [Ancylobacter polymorphus]|uniref:Autotransporter domain-containing protein n=1 Tax=Ancylobacter polymorphus TaxID=223390 RepID=A0A9E7A217_9HYPH|nr:autotransporter outer membrane beta-barrel domain-containing protein [Ancylobacter polymorphus]UOK69199.1 autotransporter domain-containing protein [Ancylobacter polymorphus]
MNRHVTSNRYVTSTSRLALVVAAAVLIAPLAAQADDFNISTATTTQQTVSGTNVGTVTGTGSITTSGVAVLWNGAATGTGISVTNDGTISSTGGRAFDTNGSSITGLYTLTNTGTISASNDTFRVNDDLANGTLTLTNSGTMSSTTGQVFDLDSASAATAVVSISNSGAITAAGQDAIRLGAGTITLTNSGTIQTTATNRKAISFDATGNVEKLVSFTLTNEEGGEIIGVNDAVKISADASTNASSAIITVINRGLIDGGAGQALDFADLTSAGNVIAITNYGTLTSATADGIRPGAGATVTNYGLIQSTDLSSDGDGIDFQKAGGTVVNKTGGQIIGAKHGITGDGAVTVTNETGATITGKNGSGINIDSTGATLVTVTNYGTIRGEVTGLIDEEGTDSVPDGDGDGVDVDGQVLLNNYGLIQGTGASGTKDGEPNTADGIAAGGGVIYNHKTGIIEAFDNYPNVDSDDVGRAILIDDSAQGPAPFATQLFNEGIIRSDGPTVTFIGTQNDTIVNSGLISSGGEVAVDMGGGNDLFVYVAGSEVVGLVLGGAGDNTFELSGAGTFDVSLLGDAAQYRDFGTLLVGELSSFTGTGVSTFDGEVQIDGSFVLNGSLAAASVAVEDGGLLGGNATVGNIVVGLGGTVSPGNSIGTVTVLGTTTFETGSFYEVELSGLASDRIVTDTLTLNGGTVVLSAIGPVYTGTPYEIISAAATTTPSSQFTLEEPDFLFVNAALGRDDASVTLTLTRNGVSLASLARTANQTSVAGALDRANGSALQATVLAGTSGQEEAIRAGYDLLSGEVHASVGTTLYFQSTLVADTLVGRLRQASAAGASPALAALATGGPVTAYAAKAPEAASPFPVKALPPEPAGPVYAAWAQGFGQWNSANGTGNSADVDSSLGGFLAGGDVTAGNVTFGLAAGYASASLDVDDRMSSADADTVLLAAYAGANFDAFRLRGGASYGWSSIDTTRSVAMLSLFENPLGSYDGSTANIFVEAAYAVEAGGVAFEPFAQMAWSWIDTDSFTETGAFTSGLASSGLSYDVPYSTLGLRLATTLAMGEGTVTPHASIAWRHAYGDITPELGMSFASTGTAFTVAGAPIAEDSFLFGAGIDFAVGANVLLNIGYEGQFASEVNTNAIKGGFTYRF